MESLTSALFANEMPDSDQELFSPGVKDLNIFHFFPKLPIEVRLAIWRLCFPAPRKVNLRPTKSSFGKRDPECLNGLIYGRWTSCRSISQHMQLPVTLYVDKESRSETLRKYRILFRESPYCPCSPRAPQPIIFNPNRDLLYIDLSSLVNGDEFGTANKPSIFRSCDFQGVKSLEIRRWMIDFGVESCLRQTGVMARCLRFFHDLEELRLVMDGHRSYPMPKSIRKKFRHEISTGTIGHLAWKQEESDRSVKFLEHCFAKLVEEDSMWQVPKITIHHWDHNSLPL